MNSFMHGLITTELCQPSFVIDEKFNGVTLTTMLFGLEVLDVGGFVMEARTPLNSPPGRP
jgi:hypothetical protein